MSKIIESSENLPHPPPLTPEQRKLITATVPILKEHGVTITTLFYRQMLEANPDLRNVFSHSKQQVSQSLLSLENTHVCSPSSFYSYSAAFRQRH